MARYRFPQDRSAFIFGADLAPILTPPRTALVIYTDEALTTPADIQDLDGGAIANSTIYVNQGVLDEFLGPEGTTRLWAARAGIAPYPLDAQALDVMAQSGGIGGVARQLWAHGTAATALSGHRAVTPASDGSLGYASNDDLDHVNAPLWITSGAVNAGAELDALMFGTMIEPSWSWTPGPVYLGTNGQLTQVPPTAPGAVFLVQVGSATSPTALFVDRSPSIKII